MEIELLLTTKNDYRTLELTERKVLLVEKDFMMHTTALVTRKYIVDGLAYSDSESKCLLLERTLLTLIRNQRTMGSWKHFIPN